MAPAGLVDLVDLAAPVGPDGNTTEVIHRRRCMTEERPRPVGRGVPYCGRTPNAAYTALLRTTLRGSALALVASNRFGT
jgi:hypothetical protein